MKLLGIEFAPLNVPLQRRLQTAAAWYFVTSILCFSTGGAVLCILLLFTRYYFISLVYLSWLYYDWDTPNQGGRVFTSIRKWRIWKYYADYYPAKLVKTADLDPTKNYIFGFHPHGILAFGSFCSFGCEATGFGEKFPGLNGPRVLTLEGNFWVPFYRDYLLALGACAVSRKSISWLLSKEGVGNVLIIVVGGAAEALDARPGETRLTIRNRKGFVRMAIMHGASLVPVYSFGENDLYHQVPNPVGSTLRSFQDKLRKLWGISLPIFTGRGIFNYTLGLLPHRRPLVTVVGKPIHFTKTENPSQEDVDSAHELYLQQLKQLFDENKEKYGKQDEELIFT